MSFYTLPVFTSQALQATNTCPMATILFLSMYTQLGTIVVEQFLSLFTKLGRFINKNVTCSCYFYKTNKPVLNELRQESCPTAKVVYSLCRKSDMPSAKKPNEKKLKLN